MAPMHSAPDFETNDRGHRVTCDCPDCMPPGADGSLDDALDAARAEMTKAGVHGRYVLRPLAKTTQVTWRGDGSRMDITRGALRAAARHVQARGLRATDADLDLYVA